MHAARRVHAREHAGIPKRQNDHRNGNNGNKPKNPLGDLVPLAKTSTSSSVPVRTTTSTTPATRGPTPTPNLAAVGGVRATSTSTTSQTTSSSLIPSSTGVSTQEPTGYRSGSGSGLANAGSLPDDEILSSDSTSGTSTSSPDSSPSTTVASTLSSGSGKSSPSGGIIAAVVIFILLFAIALILFILRKRSRTRRDEQAIRWGSSRDRTSQTYGDGDDHFSFRNSNRSSFATTFDHSTTSAVSHHHHHHPPPPPPPMAQLGRLDGTAPALILDTNPDQKRFSAGSAHSDNSQFLVIHHRESVNRTSVPDCTESFPFPKPPLVDSSSLHSRASSGARAILPILPRNEEPEILYIASPAGNNSIQPTTTTTSTSTSTIPFPPPPTQPSILTNPFIDNDPFEDPNTSLPLLPPPPPPGTLSEFQTVHRPFFPQLQDEMQVIIGDSVRVVQTFDDGWALVEKVSSNPQCELGLIPIECLRDRELVGGGGRSSDSDVLVGGNRMSSQNKIVLRET